MALLDSGYTVKKLVALWFTTYKAVLGEQVDPKIITSMTYTSGSSLGSSLHKNLCESTSSGRIRT